MQLWHFRFPLKRAFLEGKNGSFPLLRFPLLLTNKLVHLDQGNFRESLGQPNREKGLIERVRCSLWLKAIGLCKSAPSVQQKPSLENAPAGAKDSAMSALVSCLCDTLGVVGL